MKKYITVITIVFMIWVLLNIKNSSEDIKYNKISIEINKEILETEKQYRQNNAKDILYLQKKIYEEDIQKAKWLIFHNYETEDLDFYWITEEWYFIIRDYWDFYIQKYLVNIKTNTILINNKYWYE